MPSENTGDTEQILKCCPECEENVEPERDGGWRCPKCGRDVTREMETVIRDAELADYPAVTPGELDPGLAEGAMMYHTSEGLTIAFGGEEVTYDPDALRAATQLVTSEQDAEWLWDLLNHSLAVKTPEKWDDEYLEWLEEKRDLLAKLREAMGDD